MSPRSGARSGAGVRVFLPPSDVYRLQNWRAQTQRVLDAPAQGFADRHLHLLDDGSERIRFHVNCDRGLTSPNSPYRRSEYRYGRELGLARSSRAMLVVHGWIERSVSFTKCASLTLAQLHSVGDLPPLLRVYARDWNMWAAVKTDVTGASTQHVRLGPIATNGQYELSVSFCDSRVRFDANGTQSTAHVGFWPVPVHFRVGCYPQSLTGSATATVSRFGLRV